MKLKKRYCRKALYKYAISSYLRYLAILLLLFLIKKKDAYTADHCKRVMELAGGYSEYYGHPYFKANTLKHASLLHDIGKITIPKRILKKPDKLDAAEQKIIKKHPLTSFLIVKKVAFLHKEALVIRQHHERIDGYGYPLGLKDNEINELSKILSVCDAFDAMTHNRAYREKITFDEALKELGKNAGSQFDKDIVKLFCKYIKNKDTNCP